jgi:hypothetical protein
MSLCPGIDLCFNISIFDPSKKLIMPEKEKCQHVEMEIAVLRFFLNGSFSLSFALQCMLIIIVPRVFLYFM